MPVDFATRRQGRAALVLSATLLLAAGASAMTLRELRALRNSSAQGEHYARYYLVGVMEGALEAHQRDVRAGARPAICPEGRRLDPSMAQPLLDAELKRRDGLYEADMPVQLALINALAAAYTCP
jgi:hypothetical protein